MSKIVSTLVMKVFRSKRMDPLILNLGTRCRLVLSFTSRPLYPPEYGMNGRLGGSRADLDVWTGDDDDDDGERGLEFGGGLDG